MKPEDQRIAIAKACKVKINGELFPWPDCIEEHRISHIPDYLNDLNAMHEAEKILTPPQRSEYHSEIYTSMPVDWHDCTGEHIKNYVHATDAQRAESFLKTLGLWKD